MFACVNDCPGYAQLAAAKNSGFQSKLRPNFFFEEVWKTLKNHRLLKLSEVVESAEPSVRYISWKVSHTAGGQSTGKEPNTTCTSHYTFNWPWVPQNACCACRDKRILWDLGVRSLPFIPFCVQIINGYSCWTVCDAMHHSPRKAFRNSILIKGTYLLSLLVVRKHPALTQLRERILDGNLWQSLAKGLLASDKLEAWNNIGCRTSLSCDISHIMTTHPISFRPLDTSWHIHAHTVQPKDSCAMILPCDIGACQQKAHISCSAKPYANDLPTLVCNAGIGIGAAKIQVGDQLAASKPIWVEFLW